jgi:alkylated DNA nucleotide flippase Atl1
VAARQPDRLAGRSMNEEYVELVLSAVELVPPGRVASYGDIAEFVGRGGARQVGQVMSRHGAAVPWWRAVRSDGQPARGHEQEALARLEAESAPTRAGRVDMDRGRFDFGEPSPRTNFHRGSHGP